MQEEMKRDIKAVILMLATQAMINLGEINDPIKDEALLNLDGAGLFIELLEVLETKTKGNLTTEEEQFMTGVLTNLKSVYEKKLSLGN